MIRISVMMPGTNIPKNVYEFSRSPTVAAMPIANRSSGNAITISVMRDTTVSIKPP